MSSPQSSSDLSDKTLSNLYPYSFKSSQTQNNTFYGRFMHFNKVVDPRNFFITQAQLNSAKQFVASKKQEEEQLGKPLLLSKADFDKLNRSASMVNSAISRDTGDQIPRIMRMCAFVPVNVPILFGMLISPPTMFNTVFWQWFNQSFNAGLNYGNRNASSKYTNRDLALGYSAAVGSSVSVAMILRKLFSNMTRTVQGSKLILINSAVSSIAGGTASFLNTFFMRRVEMENGIEVFKDENLTEKIGISKICAKKAIFETAWSRVFLAVSCLTSPAIIFYLIESMGKTPKSKAIKIPYEIGVFLFALMVNLPASIAMFPQTGSLKTHQIEESLQRDQYGNEVKVVYYNKGL